MYICFIDIHSSKKKFLMVLEEKQKFYCNKKRGPLLLYAKSYDTLMQ